MEKSKLKIAGMVTLYNPTDSDINNISSYIDDLDKLYIIDNTEKDKNKKKIPKNKKIEYISKNENLGVATALNIGAKKAIKNGYKWLLTMDQDSKFKDGVLKKLKDVIINNDMKKVGIVTPWHNTKLKMKKAVETGFDYPPTIMTSGNIINLDVYKKVGGFKDWLFIDGVDIEYSLNIRKHGYIILRVNELELDHNLGDIKYRKFFNKEYVCPNHNYIRRYYIMRNNHYICDMYKTFDPNVCWDLIKQKDAYIEIFLFEKDKIRKILALRKGYNDYKKGIKGKLKK